MGEISFNYNINIEPINETRFKYLFSDSIEYILAYQRYVAFFDANTFNSPVAITKVATGLYQYYDLFLDKKAHATTYSNFIKNFDKVYKDTCKTSSDKHLSNTYRSILCYENLRNTIRHCLFDFSLYQNGNSLYRKDVDIDRYKDNRWLLREFSLNEYIAVYMLEKIHNDTLNEYSKMYNLHITNHMEIKDGCIAMSPIIPNPILNIYDISFGTPFRNGLNIMNTSIFGKFPDKIANKIKYMLLKTPHMELNVFDIDFGCRNELIGNIISQLYLEFPHSIHANIIDNLQTERPDNILNYNNALVAKPQKRYIISDNDIHGYIYENICTTFTEENLSKFFNSGEFNENIKSMIRAKNSFFTDEQHALYAHEKVTQYFKQNIFVISNSKNIYNSNSVFVLSSQKNISEYSDICSCFKKNHGIFKINKDTFINKYNVNVMLPTAVSIDKCTNYLRKVDNLKKIFKKEKYVHQTDELITINNNYKDICTYCESYFVTKNEHELKYHNNQLFIHKLSKGFIVQDTTSHLYKIRKSFEIKDDIVQADKIRKSFEIKDDATDVYKVRKSMSFDENNVFLFKDRKSFDIETLNGFSVYKDRINIELQNDILSMIKDRHGIYFFTNAWTLKTSHSAMLSNQYFMDKSSHYASIFKQSQSLLKSKIRTLTLDFDFIIKNYLPTDYSNILSNSYSGMIIPISKVRHQSYIDNINLMIEKISKKGYIHQDETASVISKKVYESLDLFCDKSSFKAYIDYRNNQITKLKIHSYINKDALVSKSIYYCIDNALLWIEKNTYSALSNKMYQTNKQKYSGLINEIFGISPTCQNIYINKSLFIDKNTYICYYDYGIAWADKDMKAKINKQLSIAVNEQKTHVLDCISPFVKNQLSAFYEYAIFADTVINESELCNQIREVNRKIYDAGINLHDFGNWAWVYETPDPFDGLEFRIDELLLPENDTRYENFEDIIFDKQNMRPRNPVKVIDDNTFIAKYPIKHPISKYSDVALDYEKGAIKLENFYGIETGIMHTVFLKFYRIWQNKIFEFGTMTMTQSVKLMLEYLYSWIMEYFPVDRIEQALRVFRLIRWYGESSIIQNSQYIVSYEYDTLESKLNTGTCMIPNDLDVNDTMYVDAHLGVIRNNPVYINSGTGAYVTFEIDNRKNTTFTFSLSNTVGSVNIYINDILVDTISKSALNLTYELPYTGDTNVVKIEKIASHNLNGTFFIGNIKIPNTTFKNLSIEFDPVLKAGNKPLNEIAKKMIYFANLHDNREEMYEIIRKGNLGIEETYKKLTEYWELHHSGKTKGKRLTIKEI